jgi:hypothetical protein
VALGRLVGFVTAVLSGWAASWILPVVFPFSVGVVESVLGLDTGVRDQVNSTLMTLITMGTSFLVSFVVFRGWRRE